ncbi:cytidylyltransferase domain-containing protein [Leeuwenhoekiella sp. W20_SRS_FM14]|uniref:cytidylyltransferase domain-containing protein n=1 Tax=Leeuwenhoekiella sp. W20_SRS_FM14 TaxID=3240270 RepID=UPI003F9CD2EF
MSTIAFIPVRGGSKSIPLKNIKDFCGKPLVYWTINSLENVTDIDAVIIATDSEEIIEVVESFNFKKVIIYRRLPENAIDTASTESVMLEYINNSKISIEDTFILVQATSPLLQPSDILKGLKVYETNDSVLSCVRSKRFVWSESGQPINYDHNDRPRRQDFDGMLVENGAFYINKVENIKTSRNRLSGKIGIAEMPEFTAVEIDEEEDWIIAESLMQRFVLRNNLKKIKIKLVVSDVDGVLTDAGMYYSENGDELKKFNTHDGMAFQMLRERGIKTGIVTSEITDLVKRRANKMKIDYLYQGKKHGGKLNAVLEICKLLDISIKDVAYIGDDVNCYELLMKVGVAACPNNAVKKIKDIPNILKLKKNGGEGVVRELVEELFYQ